MVRDAIYPEDWAGDAAEIKGEFDERNTLRDRGNRNCRVG
jgi:hypothetical protein